MELEELKVKLEEAREEERVLLLMSCEAQLDLEAAEDAYREIVSRQDKAYQAAHDILYEIRRRESHGI
jgi:hypothetical protein